MLQIKPVFITGIGTDVGKTVVSAIVAEALDASYWKPVQAGLHQGTDSEWVARMLSRSQHTLRTRTLPEAYKLSLPASPHIAAREEGVTISLEKIAAQLREFGSALHQLSIPGENPLQPYAEASHYLVIEGAGGLMAPLNDSEFVLDLVRALDAPIILVSRNYLGSINHSLLTAAACKAHGLKVAGWIFNDQYGHYEEEIVRWSGIPAIASIPFSKKPDPAFIREQADRIREKLRHSLSAVIYQTLAASK